jgi:sugar fermentation stimulation protein A
MIRIPLGSGGELVEATFLARPNRFLVEALLDRGAAGGEGGAVVAAHLADRGRLKETLVPGARLLLARRAGAGRKTAYQAVAAYRGGSPAARDRAMLVSLDTHLPNRLIEAALRMAALPQFDGYASLRREVRVGASRFDFQLSDGARRCTIEVKSAGLVLDGIGLFPDAPTERGRRHLRELAALARVGERVAVVFVVQGGDARAVRVDTAIDAPFAQELRLAAAAGVEIYGYACPLSPTGIALGDAVPVLEIRD